MLADWHMAGMNGLELLKAIRADENLKELAVLMITAECQRTNILEAVKAGVNGYILKTVLKGQRSAKNRSYFSRPLHLSTFRGACRLGILQTGSPSLGLRLFLKPKVEAFPSTPSSNP